MKLGVVGSRSITNNSIVFNTIANSPWSHEVLTIVSGGADGVDTSAEAFARSFGFDTEIIEPDYDDWAGEHPAKQRNTEIVEESDAIVAVWDGRSNGTRDTINKALDRGVSIYVEVVK